MYAPRERKEADAQMQAGAMPTTNTKCTEYRAYKVY